MVVSVGIKQQEVLLDRLSFIQNLKQADIELLRGLSWDFQEFPAQHVFVEVGDRPTRSCLIIEGVTCRITDLQNGERQIHALHIPGDMPDLLSLHLKVMDHSLATVSHCRLAYVKHAQLQDLCERSPTLNVAFWRETLIDAALGRASNLRLGELSAKERLAHFVCEMRCRYEAAQITDGSTFFLPLTQEIIGEFLGLSTVSVNRCLQELRGDELLRSERGITTILNWSALVALGQFDPTYLHLND